MEFNIVKGAFNTQEALDLVTQFVNTKIKYHENKISCSQTEEDIKTRESRIKELQKELFDLRNLLKDKKTDKISLIGNIKIQ